MLKRPRLLRKANELGYLLRALRNTYTQPLPGAAQRPRAISSFSDEDGPHPDADVTHARSWRRSQAPPTITATL